MFRYGEKRSRREKGVPRGETLILIGIVTQMGAGRLFELTVQVVVF